MASGPLSKSQLCWVIVRLFGLSVCLSGIAWILASIASGSGWGELFRRLLIQGAIVGWVTFYLLRRGRWVHRLLMYVHEVPEALPVVTRAPLDPETGMTQGELSRFKNWVSDFPEMELLPLEDRVARFRDSEKGADPPRT